MTSKIPVIEIFGPTIQGEGMVIGRKTMFVRTYGCDYRCSWCDSAFTWDGTGKDQINHMSAEDIYVKLKEIGDDRFNHVTISGGNPALYESLNELVDLLHEKGIKVAAETQGSKWQSWFTKMDDLTISPKPPSSGMKTDFKTLDHILDKLRKANRINNHTSLKVVIFNDEDFKYAKELHLQHQDIPLFLQVGNNDVIGEENLVSGLLLSYEKLIEKAMDSKEMNEVKVLPQLHTLVWGNKRGV